MAAPQALEVSAESDDGLIMAVAHRALPIYACSFIPRASRVSTARRAAQFLDLATAFNHSGKY